MNSYPVELLAQLVPVMFVAGLDVRPPVSEPATPSTPSRPMDSFSTLRLRLRDALVAARQPGIWQPQKNKSFQTVLVEKEVQFPPRKVPPREDPHGPLHSPLSPLYSQSPVYPDGLIAPIWIRKHTALVPSVFVLFLQIFEMPVVNPRSPLDAPDPDRERERDQEERRRDAELSAEIAQRKKGTNDRGIKLTVVLLASRRMLDDPSLDARLTFIRRQSGLDSRAALFVLSPVSAAELGDFVTSLQQALFEPALEYYTAHSKRVRRKRNRHSQAPSTSFPMSPLGSAPIARPLRPEGWTVRYEFKMACFAEFRGEDEVALKHYQDAYAMLCIMFGSTAILPPRTKRWAEAKVLADCISIKVCKLYLYNNEHALALSHHNTHMRKFADFSRGWGIGEETYEFWSWMARQHRVLAELIDQGVRSGTLTIPSHRPIPTSTLLEVDAMRSLGLNPSHALHHAGFYYYMAAQCTEHRRERFLVAVEAEATRENMQPSPGFSNEKKVDHLTIILELYTKSYELFNKHSPGRLALWIAYHIGRTYYHSGKFDTAVQFFARIAKTYRRERWESLLIPLLSTWYACAQRLGDVELSVKLLFEMLGHGKGHDEEPETLQEDIMAVLTSTVPASTEGPLVIEETEPLLDSSVVFWQSEVQVNEPAAFQICLSSPVGVVISALPVRSVTVFFQDEDAPPFIIQHVDIDGWETSPVRKVELGQVTPGAEVDGCLRWMPGSNVVLAGMMSSPVPVTLMVSKIVVTIKQGNWWIEFPIPPCSQRRGFLSAPRWLASLDPPRFVPVTREEVTSAIVCYRPHDIEMSLGCQSPAYLEESFPVTISVTNLDERELDVSIDVLLQPSEIDFAVNAIVVDEERSSGLIKAISLGVIASGATVQKTLYLVSSGAPGDRMIDVSVQSRSTATPLPPPREQVEGGEEHDEEESTAANLDTSQLLQTLVVSTVEAVSADFAISYRRSLNESLGLADSATYEIDFWDDGDGGEAVVKTKFTCVGPWGIEVQGIKLVRQDGLHAKILDCSSDGVHAEAFPGEYLPGDEFCEAGRLSLAPPELENDEQLPIPGPGKYEITWKRIDAGGKRGSTSTSRFPLPSLLPPRDGLIALLTVPGTAKLHMSLPLQLRIRNRHPTRSANVTVQLEPDSTDGFIATGLRSGRIPILMPGAEETLTWKLIPLECGYLKLPKFKVVDRRKAIASSQGAGGDVETEGDAVKVVDVRWDQTSGKGEKETTDLNTVVLVLP